MQLHGTKPTETADFLKGQIVNIDKPLNWTSFDVVKKVRNSISAKVGHAGTLDPFATGVLLLCTGRATKKVSDLMGLEKVYDAHIELGKRTDTFDLTGEILEEKSIVGVEEKNVMSALQTFIGELLQTPPMYSAIKQNGVRLYKLARQGITVERNPRKVQVHNMSNVVFDLPSISCTIHCSKGTYIRSIADELGQLLGVGAYLKGLRRTRIGDYAVEDAWVLSDFLKSHSN